MDSDNAAFSVAASADVSVRAADFDVRCLPPSPPVPALLIRSAANMHGSLAPLDSRVPCCSDRLRKVHGKRTNSAAELARLAAENNSSPRLASR